MAIKKWARGSILLAFSFLFIGCASYQSNLSPLQKDIRGGQPRSAAEKVKAKAFAEGKDQVVYLLEYATSLQIAEDYQASNEAFLLAEQLTEVKDYHSISKTTASLLSSARMQQYKGEDYEKVLINGMLAINFLMLKNNEAAMVESRKLNDKLYRYKFEAKKPYEQNSFAFYLAAMVREEERDWDGAYIDYKRAYDLNPNIKYIKSDLVRSAHRARRSTVKKKWQKQFGISGNQSLPKGYGEVVVIYQQGWAPRKKPHPNWHRIPKLFSSYSDTEKAKLILVDASKSEESTQLYSVTDVSMKVLNNQYTQIIATRAAGIAAKAVVADQVRQKNKLLGELAWIGMNIADQADLRQWLTLPSSFNVIRMQLPEGEHKVQVVGLNGAGASTGESSNNISVVIKSGQKTFVQWRSVK